MRQTVIAIAVFISAAGCKQGLGERCQVTADCSGDLVCNQATGVCATPGMSGGIDAEPPPDAPTDAPVSDAAHDAP